MGDAWIILTAVKTALSSVAGVNSCKIGINSDISPDDYPIIRIVPDKIGQSPTMGRVSVSVWVYYGVNLTEADGGLEGVYQSLMTLQNAIVSALHADTAFVATWQETVTDEDRLDQFKIFASRFTIVG